MGKMADVALLFVVLISLIFLILFFSWILSGYLSDKKDSLESAKKVSETIESYKQAAIQEIMNNINYKTLNGSNVMMTGQPILCGKDCYNFSFEYTTNQSLYPWIAKMDVGLIVEEGVASNVSYSGVFYVDDFKDCVGAGNNVVFPKCENCSPYCVTSDGEIFYRDN